MTTIGKHTKTDLLRQVPFFAKLSRKHLDSIATMVDELDVRAGDIMASQGERGYEFALILEGQAKVVRDCRVVNRLSGGDFFGEVALFDGDKRLASVIAETDMRLLVAHRQYFHALLEESPPLHREIHSALCRYLRESKPDERFCLEVEPDPKVAWAIA